MSSKINYDVLRSLTSSSDVNEEGASTSASASAVVEPVTVIESGPIIPLKRKLEQPSGTPYSKKAKVSKSKKKSQPTTLVPLDTEAESSNAQLKLHETDDESLDGTETPPVDKLSQSKDQKIRSEEEILEDLPSETEETGEAVVEAGGVNYVDDDEEECK